MKTAMNVTSLILAAIAIFGGSARASTDAPEITVRYTKATDASHLYARLQVASASVCRQHEGKELRQVAAARACYNEALDNAVAKVGNSTLTALHQANVDMRVAMRDATRKLRS